MKSSKVFFFIVRKLLQSIDDFPYYNESNSIFFLVYDVPGWTADRKNLLLVFLHNSKKNTVFIPKQIITKSISTKYLS